MKKLIVTNEIKEDFKKDFCRVMYELNRANASTQWWAMNFTSKSPLSARLFDDTFKFACGKENRKIRLGLIGAVKNYTPFLIIYAIFKIIFRKILSLLFLNKIPAASSVKLAMVTQFENKSINNRGVYRDIYFGDFKNLIREYKLSENQGVITIGYVACNFMRLIRGLRKNKDIYPIDYFISLSSIWKCLVIGLKRYFMPVKFKGSYEIHGLNLDSLLHDEIRESIRSGQFTLNLSVYFALKDFLKIYDIKILYYPFENRSWEKMINLAARDSLSKTAVVGYQHSSVIPKHLNFFMAPGEYTHLPHPDRIVTIGEVTKEMLEKWNFPKDSLVTGCALRQNLNMPLRPYQKNKKIRSILVALASGIDEYVRVLAFLDEALSGNTPYDIVIRPHPIIRFAKALKIFKPRNLKYRLSDLSLADDLSNCDVVLYASSTLCLEAASMGKPVIYLELGDLLNSDPMFNINTLKWNCSKPGELRQLINRIDELEESEMRDMQMRAASYAGRYFYKITRENLASFISGL